MGGMYWRAAATVVLGLLAALGTGLPAGHCPDKCLCFRTTVRCMFLQLDKVPQVPEETTVLDLRFNRIKEIPRNTFKDLKNINTLLLNNNHISRLVSGAFTGLKELRYLYLYKNRIKSIDSKAFQGLTNLEQLYLHFNRIDTLEPGTFAELKSLDRLFLHNNKLSHIPRGAFGGVDSLRRLRLDSNALICDCQMKWLGKMLKDKQTVTQAAATCEYPSSLQGKSLAAISDNDFRCKLPTLTEEPHDVLDVSFGGTVYFHCKAEGDPDPNIVWLHNNNEIAFQNRYSLLQDGTLMIENAQDVDQGVYECMAKNSAGEVKSRKANMHYRRHAKGNAVTVDERPERTKPKQQSVPSQPLPHSQSNQHDGSNHIEKAKPRFLETPQGQEVRRGEKLTLRCDVTGNPKPQIRWTHNDSPVPHHDRHKVLPTGSLEISNMQIQDAGSYRCSGVSYLGQVSAYAHVKVQVPPAFTDLPRDEVLIEGRSAEFNCRAEGNPQPHITWIKDGRTIVPDPRRPVVIDLGGTVLRISNIRKSDEGTYYCRAQNIAGAVDTSFLLQIKEKIPPSFHRTPHNMEVEAGVNVELPCQAGGDPKPIIVWRKDGVVMPEDRTHRFNQDGSLYIYNITGHDAGMYECAADNGIGHQSVFAEVKVKEKLTTRPGDRFVEISLEEARTSVNRAFNDTINSLFGQRRVYTPAEMLRLFRFPGPSAREIARAGEIYERTLLIVKRHVEEGARFRNLSEFSYKDVLSPNQLETIASVSGCLGHRRNSDCADMCFHNRYRTFDGSCNNLQHPMWGSSETAFYRLLSPVYENGFNTPVGWSRSPTYHGYAKPSARLVSTRIISTDDISADDNFSHMLMQWGQFLDHDLDLAPPTISSERFVDGEDCSQSCEYSPPCFPIEIPAHDPRIQSQRCMEFTRSSPICGSGSTSLLFESVMPREQINVLTSYIDASQVYGSFEEEAKHLRDLTDDLGLLRRGPETLEGKHLLPFNDHWPIDCRRDPRESNVGCFLAGDTRVNEQLALVAMHTIWFREHNRVAKELLGINPQWDGELLYHEARKIVIAEMQHITYEHWLPKIFGPKGMEIMGPYNGYNPNVQSSISNAFATAALRFGHTLINPILHRLNASFQAIPQGHLPLSKSFFSPYRIIEEGGIDPLIRGLFSMPAKLRKDDQLLNKELTENLFRQVHAVSLDLAAINIQRGRDHALPGYNEWRRFCNLTHAETFEDLKKEIKSKHLRDQLRLLYGHPSNIDLWVGGVSEDLVEGGRTGPTFMCILADQFRRLRDGDRFFYENPGVFKPEQLTQIKQSSLARVVCDNGDDIAEVTLDSFVIPQRQTPPYVKCGKVPVVDLRFWTECCSDCSRSGDFNSITGLSERSRRSTDFSYPKDKPSTPVDKLYANQTYMHTSQAGTDSSKVQDSLASKEISVVGGEQYVTEKQVTTFLDRQYDVTEERMEGLEMVIRQLKKEMRQLNKKVSQLESHYRNGRGKHCIDSTGKDRRNGETWHIDSCSSCTCKKQQVTCQVQVCPTLSCASPILAEGACCPVC